MGLLYYNNNLSCRCEALLGLQGQVALAAVLAVRVLGHEHGRSTLGALLAQTGHLAITVDLVILQDGQFDFGALVLDLLGGGVGLLFLFLGTTTQAQHQVQGGLLLDVVVGQGAAVFQLLTSKD